MAMMIPTTLEVGTKNKSLFMLTLLRNCVTFDCELC